MKIEIHVPRVPDERWLDVFSLEIRMNLLISGILTKEQRQTMKDMLIGLADSTEQEPAPPGEEEGRAKMLERLRADAAQIRLDV